MIKVSSRGSFKKSYTFLNRAKKFKINQILNKYGKLGVEALEDNTPVSTGLTAASWDYEINQNGNDITITWTNSNVNHGVNIALLLQLGHATRNGGFVQGRDYITPAMEPIFKKIMDEAWREVTEA